MQRTHTRLNVRSAARIHAKIMADGERARRDTANVGCGGGGGANTRTKSLTSERENIKGREREAAIIHS